MSSDSRSLALLELQRYFWNLLKVTDEECNSILGFLKGNIGDLVDPELLRMKAPCRVIRKPILTASGRMVVQGEATVGIDQVWATAPMSYDFELLAHGVGISHLHIPKGDKREDPAFSCFVDGTYIYWGDFRHKLEQVCDLTRLADFFIEVDQDDVTHLVTLIEDVHADTFVRFVIEHCVINDKGGVSRVDRLEFRRTDLNCGDPALIGVFGGRVCFRQIGRINRKNQTVSWMTGNPMRMPAVGDVTPDLDTFKFDPEQGVFFVGQELGPKGETHLYHLDPNSDGESFNSELLGCQVDVVLAPNGHYYWTVPSASVTKICSTDPEWQLDETMYPESGDRILFTDNGIVYAVTPGNEAVSFHPDGTHRHSANSGHCKWYRSLGSRIVGANRDGIFAEIDTTTSVDEAMQRAFPKSTAKSFGMKLEDLVLLPNDKIRAVRQEGDWILSILEFF
jgi:hypothetical protein